MKKNDIIMDEKKEEIMDKKYQVIYSGGELTTSKIENYETNKI